MINQEHSEPIFCSVCGRRIGWSDESYGNVDNIFYCEDCVKEDDENV